MKPWFKITNAYGRNSITVHPGKKGLPTFTFVQLRTGGCEVIINQFPKVRSLNGLRKHQEVLRHDWFKVAYVLEGLGTYDAVVDWLRNGDFVVEGMAYNFHEGRP